jgi:hypothetical protein
MRDNTRRQEHLLDPHALKRFLIKEIGLPENGHSPVVAGSVQRVKKPIQPIVPQPERAESMNKVLLENIDRQKTYTNLEGLQITLAFLSRIENIRKQNPEKLNNKGQREKRALKTMSHAAYLALIVLLGTGAATNPIQVDAAPEDKTHEEEPPTPREWCTGFHSNSADGDEGNGYNEWSPYYKKCYLRDSRMQVEIPIPDYLTNPTLQDPTAPKTGEAQTGQTEPIKLPSQVWVNTKGSKGICTPVNAEGNPVNDEDAVSCETEALGGPSNKFCSASCVPLVEKRIDAGLPQPATVENPPPPLAPIPGSLSGEAPIATPIPEVRYTLDTPLIIDFNPALTPEEQGFILGPGQQWAVVAGLGTIVVQLPLGADPALFNGQYGFLHQPESQQATLELSRYLADLHSQLDWNITAEKAQKLPILISVLKAGGLAVQGVFLPVALATDQITGSMDESIYGANVNVINYGDGDVRLVVWNQGRTMEEYSLLDGKIVRVKDIIPPIDKYNGPQKLDHQLR